MRQRRAILWGSLAVAGLAIVLALLDAPAWMRAPFGLAVVAFVPGYALIEALDPKRRVGGMERLALAIGTSVAVTVVSGLLLSGSPAGLRTVTWSAGVGGLSIATCLLGLHATRGQTLARAEALTPHWRRVLAETGIVLALTGTLALTLTSVAATDTLGSEQSVEQGRGSVLQLWALPTDDSATGTITVGIENPTNEPVECILVVRQGQIIIRDEPLVLEPDGALDFEVRPAENASIMFPVEVALTSSDRADTLRRVAVWPGPATRLTNEAADPEG